MITLLVVLIVPIVRTELFSRCPALLYIGTQRFAKRDTIWENTLPWTEKFKGDGIPNIDKIRRNQMYRDRSKARWELFDTSNKLTAFSIVLQSNVEICPNEIEWFYYCECAQQPDCYCGDTEWLHINAPSSIFKDPSECPKVCWVSPWGGLGDVTKLEREEVELSWIYRVAMLQRGDVYYNLTETNHRYQFEVNYKMRVTTTQVQNDRMLFKSPIGDAACPHDISVMVSVDGCNCKLIIVQIQPFNYLKVLNTIRLKIRPSPNINF